MEEKTRSQTPDQNATESVRLSRRAFLKKTGIMAAVLGAAPYLAACAGAAPAAPSAGPASGNAAAATPASGNAPAAVATSAAPAVGQIKGTSLNIFWFTQSIPESAAAEEKGVQTWADQAGVNLTLNKGGNLGDVAATLATFAETKQGADLVNMYQMDVAVNGAVMLDVTDMANELGTKLGGWYDGPKSVCIQNGKWKALPVCVYGEYWHYRMDLFQQAGVDKWPTTWEELHAIGKQLKPKGFPIGFVLGHAVTDGNVHVYSLLWSYGGRDFSDDGKSVAIDSPETLACLEFFKDFYHDACAENTFGWDEGGNNQGFNSGQNCATINANTIYNQLSKNAPTLVGKVGLGGTLKGPAGAYMYESALYWGIPSYSKNPDAARAFLRDSFYDLKFQSSWTKAGGGYNLPSFAGLEKDDSAWPTDPNLAVARQLPKAARMPGSPGPFTPIVGQSMNKFLVIDMFAKVAQGSTPKDAIKATVDEMNALLKA